MAALRRRTPDRRVRAWAAALVLAAVCVPCARAEAQVTATPEAAGPADAVYVAGNPDWYPVEYYDEETGAYEGVLPRVLEVVSERMGVDFAYVHAGPEDLRERLAANGQVEIVSGCSDGDAWLDAPCGSPDAALQESGALVAVPAAAGGGTARVAFTRIADEGLADAFASALAEVDGAELAGASIALDDEPAGPETVLAVALVVALVLLAGLCLAQSAQLRRYRLDTARDTDLDALTSIWSKAYLVAYYREHVTSERRPLYCMAHFGFDIARVNRYYGEDAAEDQLCFAASELEAAMGEGEVAARVSGGGLAALHRTGDVAEARAWAERMVERLNGYTERYGRDYRPDFRAGIYMLGHADDDCDAVLNSARRGYAQAVADGAPCAVVGARQLKLEAERLRLKKEALDALRAGEFKMYLQFIVDARDGAICAAEAVSRWDHPRRGLLYPGGYIDIMEDEGTISELDYHIFEQACRLLETWCAQGRSLSVSCNFSRITIGRAGFVGRIGEICGRYDFDRRLLLMEITEAAMESNRDAAYANISRCKQMGFRIALDDTGDGNTSFSDLRDYPIDVVKVDRSILNAAATPRGAALLRGVVALVHSLDMSALGEGAETAEQVELLREAGCDYIQGYFYYRPLPLDEALRVLDEERPAPAGA